MERVVIWSASTALMFCFAFSSPARAATCDFTISNEWGSGFTSSLTIVNDGSDVIDGWQVDLEFADGATISGMWNANLTGNNPYSATNKGHNQTIAPGSSAEFGFNASKAVENVDATPPVLGGICNSGSNAKPIARATASLLGGEAPLTIHFDGLASSDPEGDTLSWLWDFGDGHTATASTPTHTYVDAGSYTVSLTVNDGTQDSINTATLNVTAEQPEPTTAECEFDIRNEWDHGFTSDVYITNTANAAISGWTVVMDFGGTATVSNSWNTEMSGSNPYEASNVGWNEEIDPGETVSFGFNSNKTTPYTAASLPTLGGLCAGSSSNLPPVAEATHSIPDPASPLTVQFDSSASHDPNGDALSYVWDFGDGNSATVPSPLHTYTDGGSFDVTLTVSNPSGEADSTTINVTVAPAPVTADCEYDIRSEWDHGFTSDIHITNSADQPIVGWNISLDFAGNAEITNHWSSEITGSDPYDISPADWNETIDPGETITIGFNSDKATPYTPALLPTLGGLCATSNHNRAPVAQAEANPTQGAVPLAVSFEGDSSYDLNGDALSYAWDFGDGNSSSEANPTHSYAVAGDFTATLTVTDPDQASDTATVTINATPPAPTTADCEFVIRNEWDHGFTSDVFLTNNADQAINGWSVEIDFGGTAAITNSWNVEMSGSSPYVAQNVDWNGSIDPGETVEFGFNSDKVTPYTAAQLPGLGGLCEGSIPNRPPSAVATADPTSGNAPLVVNFNAAGSNDPDGNALTYNWAFGDGASSTDSAPNHSYATAGNYDVTLTVTDEHGASGTASLSIAVTEEPTLAWTLDPAASSLNFVSTKKLNIIETHKFTNLSGNILSDGQATVVIDLNSIDSGIAIRDERMREHLFKTDSFPSATVSLALDANLPDDLAIGEVRHQTITPTLDLHGVTLTLEVAVRITRLKADTVFVQSTRPIIVKAEDFNLVSGIETLRSIAGLSSIGYTVPAHFILLFRAAQ